MTHTQDGLDLLGGFGEQHAERHDTEIRQRVAFVGVQLFGGSNQAARTDNSAQFLNDASVHAGLSAAGRLLLKSNLRRKRSLPHRLGKVKPRECNWSMHDDPYVLVNERPFS